MNKKLFILGVIGTLIFLALASSMIANFTFAASTIITNMTPATTSGGYIGNSTHNYTFVGVWGGAPIYGYYNSSTIPAYALITNLVGYLGNWTADKSSYSTTTALSSVGNWTNDRGNYINITRAWTNDTNIGISGSTVSWLSTLADARITSATTWSNKAGTGTCGAGQFTQNTTTSGVQCLTPSTYNISYHNFWNANISAKTDYVNNATERTLFLSTANTTYDAKSGTGTCGTGQFIQNTTTTGVQCLTPSTYNSSYVQIGGDLGGSVTAPTVINTQGLTWGNITSAWSFAVTWLNTLGGSNITNNSITVSNLVAGTLAWGNLSGYNLNSAWTNTLGGGNITTGSITNSQIASGTITTAQLMTGTLNQANLTNTATTCSNQFSRGISATSNNCATIGNADITSGAYSAITGIGMQAQNMDMGQKNITNVTLVNVTTQVMISNTIFINGTGIYKVGGGSIVFA